uniref:Uncharacterized protein n=1 Tax=Rhizophagus irregularis (strain DAOM 181602 / DAOM 197198 / MUCL 43194) TaxID=747089 RepID=U9TX11_RHIID
MASTQFLLSADFSVKKNKKFLLIFKHSTIPSAIKVYDFGENLVKISNNSFIILIQNHET